MVRACPGSEARVEFVCTTMQKGTSRAQVRPHNADFLLAKALQGALSLSAAICCDNSANACPPSCAHLKPRLRPAQHSGCELVCVSTAMRCLLLVETFLAGGNSTVTAFSCRVREC